MTLFRSHPVRGFPSFIPGLLCSGASEYPPPPPLPFIPVGLFPESGVPGSARMEMSFLLQRAYLGLYHSARVCLNVAVGAAKVSQAFLLPVFSVNAPDSPRLSY